MVLPAQRVLQGQLDRLDQQAPLVLQDRQGQQVLLVLQGLQALLARLAHPDLPALLVQQGLLDRLGLLVLLAPVFPLVVQPTKYYKRTVQQIMIRLGLQYQQARQ